ncbi:TRAP transporter small permease [Georhizobium sp. MAB10]|jgi:TRAP-type C4-dicarboxylate transport system permease small subunit|uniref:TRAP transporter small permease n=1 Tax=Georhizobium sp. MAB10 TaxID=3028319 RepID=UPI003855C2CE
MNGAPEWFKHYERAVKSVNRAFAAAASLLTLIIVMLVLLAVATRIGGSPALWPYDVAQFTLVYVVFLAMAPALESGHHVVVELFDGLVPGTIRPFVGHVAMALVILFGAIFLWHLYRVTARAFDDDRLAVAAIAIPLKWVYLIGPIGIAQFILTALMGFGRATWPSAAAFTARPDH